MLNHEHSRDASSLQKLTAPGTIGQIIEIFTGSVRRDALLAIRTSTAPHWSIEEKEGEGPSIKLNHPLCRAQFRFTAANRFQLSRLESLTISSDRGSAQVVPAETRAAQGFIGCAQERLSALLTQQKGEALALLQEIFTGAPLPEGCSCSFKQYDINEHDSQHSDRGYRKNALFITPHGSIELTRELRDFEVKGELRREMLDSYRRACAALDDARFVSQHRPPRLIFSEPSFFGVPASSFFEDRSNTILSINEAVLPPLPDGRIDSASATFHHPVLERILTLLDARKSDLIIDFDKPRIDQVLGVIKKLSDLSATNHL